MFKKKRKKEKKSNQRPSYLKRSCNESNPFPGQTLSRPLAKGKGCLSIHATGFYFPSTLFF
jgi:hypothetical protein